MHNVIHNVESILTIVPELTPKIALTGFRRKAHVIMMVHILNPVPVI
jgi:hypothetical protein